MQREYKNISLTHSRAFFAPLWLKDVMVYSTTHFVRPFPFVRVWFFPRLSLQSQRSSFHTLTLVHAHTHSLFLHGPGPSQNFRFAFHSGFLYFCMHTMKILNKDLKGLARIYSRKNCICTGQSYKLEICFCYMMIERWINIHSYMLVPSIISSKI